MALSIPSYPNPLDDQAPLQNAYGYIAGLGLDLSRNSGALTLNVHPNANAWQRTPAGQLQITLGQQLVAGDPNADPPVEAVNFKTLEEFMQDSEFAAAFAVIAGKLYAAALPHPDLAGATVV